MKIVIDITTELYGEIKNGIYDSNTRKMAIAIGNGIVLPPDHGDLIDRDKLEDEFGIEDADIYAIDVIREMPVIVPADKEGER